MGAPDKGTKYQDWNKVTAASTAGYRTAIYTCCHGESAWSPDYKTCDRNHGVFFQAHGLSEQNQPEHRRRSLWGRKNRDDSHFSPHVTHQTHRCLRKKDPRDFLFRWSSSYVNWYRSLRKKWIRYPGSTSVVIALTSPFLRQLTSDKASLSQRSKKYLKDAFFWFINMTEKASRSRHSSPLKTCRARFDATILLITHEKKKNTDHSSPRVTRACKSNRVPRSR